MFGRRYCACNKMTLLVAVIIASAFIPKNIFVDANEQQQAEQLGKEK